MAQGQAPPPIQPNQPFAPAYVAAPAPPPKKSNTLLYAVVAIVVVIVVVIAAAAALSSLGSNGSGNSGSSVHRFTTNVVNTQNQQFGPGTTGAGVYAFTVPANATGAWLNGSFQVTTCTSVGNYCLADALVLTPSEWANYQSGGSVSVVWCYGPTGGSCQAEQNVAVASGNLVGYAGQSLDFVCVSGATTLSQQYSADVAITYLTT